MIISFAGRHIAVSGAGHGLGRAMAQSFADLGGTVHACDINAGSLAETASGRNIVPTAVDLRDRKAGADWIAAIGAPVYCLVNCAGGVAGQAPRPLEDVSDAEWDILFDINVHAAMALSRAVAPGMKAAGTGRIVNISSGAGLQASLTGIQGYCSAKHALIGLTRQLAHELGPFGITVNSVAPGFVRSNPSTERQWESYGADGQADLLRRIALNRLGTAQEIANGVIFFASDLASYVNGQILSVDGGR